MASFQDRAQHSIAQLDKELSKYPVLNNLERQTSVPKVYVILGLGGIYTFLVFFNIAGQFLTNLAGFLIPTYYSLNALFTAGKADDTQWLTYWVVFSFFTVIESAVSAPYWFPFYYIFKFVLVLWLSLPQTK
ncbi:TB2/DP1, HVA22 family-domain-containing protein [Aspergillus oleicola]